LGAQSRDALLVSPAWLAAHLKDPNVVILHVGDREKYAAKHIPGARFIGMEDISVSDHSGMSMPGGMPEPPLVGPKNGLMLEMPTPEQLRSQLAKFGISDNSRIIVYETDEWISPSTRVVFTLDYAGLGSNTSMLDGGLTAWITDKRDVTDAVPPPAQPGKLSALKLRPIIATAEYVHNHAAKPGVALIDARTGSFYDGIPPSRGDGDKRKGHIPGARSIPFNTLNDVTEKLKPADQLTAIFSKAGVQPGDTVVAYCHVGQQATAVLFAARTLGHPVLLYDGSWNDYDGRTQYPVETPPAKGKP
jgi:thiosulfate/3-mercaptopyruvate sulfurtransferase